LRSAQLSGGNGIAGSSPESRLRGRRPAGLGGNLRQVVEHLRLFDRGLAEHLAVQRATGVAQAVHERAVAGAAHAAGGGDAGDPQAPHVALALAPVGVGEGAAADDRIAGEVLVAVAGPVVAASLAEQLLTGLSAG